MAGRRREILTAQRPSGDENGDNHGGRAQGSHRAWGSILCTHIARSSTSL
jgi:hypothetical protein